MERRRVVGVRGFFESVGSGVERRGLAQSPFSNIVKCSALRIIIIKMNFAQVCHYICWQFAPEQNEFYVD